MPTNLNVMWPFFNKREGQDKAAMFNLGHKNNWCQAELDEYVTDHPIDKTGLDDAAFLRTGTCRYPRVIEEAKDLIRPAHCAGSLSKTAAAACCARAGSLSRPPPPARPRPPALARPFRRPPPAAHARMGACAGPFSTSSAAATCISRPRTLPCVRGPVLDAQGHCRLHHPPAARTPMRLRCPGPPPPASARARSHTCAGSFSTSSAADSWTAAAASACFDARCLRCVRGLVHAPPPLLLPTAPCTLPCVRGLAHATAAAASATSAARARSHACAGSLMRPPPPLAVSTPAAPRTLPCVCELAHATAAAACFDTHRPAHAPMRAQPLPISTPVARARRPDACAGSVLRRCRRSFQHPRTLPCARGLAHATAAAPATLCMLPCMRGLAHASAAAARFKVRCPCTPRCVRGLAHTPPPPLVPTPAHPPMRARACSCDRPRPRHPVHAPMHARARSCVRRRRCPFNFRRPARVRGLAHATAAPRFNARCPAHAPMNMSVRRPDFDVCIERTHELGPVKIHFRFDT
ncbi:hypothetical protein GGX14DRAFT_578098 [Mycena pura]|uniref:Uncharacterized protein n=1 Tax=Mycena pura TaxID=153505 RepID=A0AAD6UQI0_9AGAR|nr:hypothetical protein GGX14DRAFT_578098 [Mycena pura]